MKSDQEHVTDLLQLNKSRRIARGRILSKLVEICSTNERRRTRVRTEEDKNQKIYFSAGDVWKRIPMRWRGVYSVGGLQNAESLIPYLDELTEDGIVEHDILMVRGRTRKLQIYRRVPGKEEEIKKYLKSMSESL